MNTTANKPANTSHIITDLIDCLGESCIWMPGIKSQAGKGPALSHTTQKNTFKEQSAAAVSGIPDLYDLQIDCI